MEVYSQKPSNAIVSMAAWQLEELSLFIIHLEVFSKIHRYYSKSNAKKHCAQG